MIDKKRGRLTLPSEANFYDETIEMLEKLGADAIRDSDGTYLPEDIKDIEGVDIYTNFFPSRGHNEFAETVPFERSRYFLISDFITATEDTTEISFLKGYYPEQIIADYDYEPKDWWEVYD
ncbi:MAG: 1,3-beta-galactosyl-N-acetylhexosamine phosphorylase N-terminal domain-containing protein, partial [Anaerococcus prevotii]|nr:1,3-beta-galactosyl-N-acetylhexosamine phosphorylase N-terminal domain-containing protein [Anaerococcus prevotii]